MGELYFDFDKFLTILKSEKLTLEELNIIQKECYIQIGKTISLNSIQEYLKTSPIILGRSVKDVYDDYVKFCQSIQFEPKSKIALSKYISNNCKYKTDVIKSKNMSIRVYVTEME